MTWLRGQKLHSGLAARFGHALHGRKSRPATTRRRATAVGRWGAPGWLALLLLACGDDRAPTPVCAAPAALGGSAETLALAAMPARCGAPAYRWLQDVSLGNVLEFDRDVELSANILVALAKVQNVTLPRPLQYGAYYARLRYQTQDRGQLRESTAGVAWPTDMATPAPIMLLLHGTSGFRRDCGPTADPAGPILAQALASMGWVVVAPDYLGMESAGAEYGAVHPYLVGEATAMAALDAVRAARHLMVSQGRCPGQRLVAFGGSQGGHAALWVDRLAPHYAPELDLAGVAAVVPPTDLIVESERALTNLVDASANVLASIATQAPWYGTPDLAPWLNPPWDTKVLEDLARECVPKLEVPPSLDEVFAPSLRAAAQAQQLTAASGPGCWLAENSLTRTSIPRLATAAETAGSYGILYVVAEADTLVTPAQERASYDALCQAGLPLTYLECAGAEHVQGVTWSLGEVLTFLEARVAGQPFTAACARPPAVRCSGTP